MSLGSRIASIRGYRRLTQEELGNMVGVSKQTMSGWEHDSSRPNADYLRSLCKALGCSADYLLELDDNPNLK
jgi:transcriptional regulator with XRE-family HTH domain